MAQYFEAARKRIEGINWQYKDRYRPSHALLVDEFIRRGNIFLDYIHKNPHSRLAVFSAVHEIGADLPINIKEICPELNQITEGWTAKYLCTFYLEWAYFMDQKMPVAVQFQDLYDPIIKLYEKGGRINYHHHELICGSHGWSRNSANFPRNLQPEDIADEVLDEYDNEWYYRKITDELNKLCHNLNVGEQNTEKMTINVLEKIKEYSHTSSKNMIIKIELAKLLLSKGINSIDRLKEIQKELEQFNMDDLEKWLPEVEKKDLVIQRTEMLNRLNRLGSLYGLLKKDLHFIQQ